MRNKTILRIIVFVCLAMLLDVAVWAEDASNSGHWVSAWSTAVHAPLPFPGLPPSPVFENQTIRMIVRPTIGGERLRIRFSNAFGATSLRIGSAHVALSSKASAIIPKSDHPLTFGGKAAVTVPPGAPILSDPIELKVLPLSELAVTVYLPEKTASSTVHFWAQHETYISESGDFTARQEIPNPTIKSSWYWLAGVEVWAPNQTSAAVTFGDSITDGVGAKQGEYSDWPDLLADRLAAGQNPATLAVTNEGIGGNRILHDGAGVSALGRLDRDVLAQPGISILIVLEGINDVGFPHLKPRLPDGTTLKELPFTHEVVSAEDLIIGLQQIVERARQHGIRVFGATLTPFEGADYYSSEGESARETVNHWILSSGAFDGIIDFDAAVRDPQTPNRLRPACDSGDHLHPSAAGYRAMADAIDVSVLKSARNAGTKR